MGAMTMWFFSGNSAAKQSRLEQKYHSREVTFQ
jgi:hypothetical protein